MPPSAGYLASLVAQLKSAPAEAIVRAAYNDPKAVDWLSGKTGIPRVDLAYTVGGTAEARDLFSLFDDSIARLKAARR